MVRQYCQRTEENQREKKKSFMQMMMTEYARGPLK